MVPADGTVGAAAAAADANAGVGEPLQPMQTRE